MPAKKANPAIPDSPKQSTSSPPTSSDENSTRTSAQLLQGQGGNADMSDLLQAPPPEVANMSAEERQLAEKKLVRKIDLRLLPMVIIMYILNYLDRNNIAAAKILGHVTLEEDLNLSDTQYELCVSILYVGYILMQVPSNLFLNKFGKPAIYLPTVMVVWGTISACTAATQNFGGLVAIRFILGFVEAAYFPGVLYFLSCWYTRKELAFRTAVLYSGSLISGAFSGFIAAGIQSGMEGDLGINAWRWLFIIEGCVTIVVAIISYFILPNFPRTTPWLSERERELAAWRLKEDIGLDDWVSVSQQSFGYGARLAFTDVKTYLLMALLAGFVSAGSVTNFFPTVVETLGYNSNNTLLLTVPPYVLAVITSFLNSWHADRTGERFFHITIPAVIGIIGFILAAATTSLGARYFAMMIMLTFYAGYVVALAWISNSIPRPPAKRAAAVAAINAVSNITNIYGSFMYNNAFQPRYVIAMTINCVTCLMSICAAVALRRVLVRLNRRLDRGEEVEGAVKGREMEVTASEGARQKGFRFLV